MDFCAVVSKIPFYLSNLQRLFLNKGRPKKDANKVIDAIYFTSIKNDKDTFDEFI